MRMWEVRRHLMETVECACRQAIDHDFAQFVLVGSAALLVTTPGSDLDAVLFTHSKTPDHTDVLTRVYWALSSLVDPSEVMIEIVDARVPILRVLWSYHEECYESIALDVSVDQTRPVDHISWFSKVGACPRGPGAPPPRTTPLVTLTLRCVKWWLRQRAIPRSKEGGLATLPWLLLAVHVCSLPSTQDKAMAHSRQPMEALLRTLHAFFDHYAGLEQMDGCLKFLSDGTASEFQRNPRNQKRQASHWADLSILDPTRGGEESLNLAPRLAPATQLLLLCELRRSARCFRRAIEQPGDARHLIQQVFEPVPGDLNVLPCRLVTGSGILLLQHENTDFPGILELAKVERVERRPGWSAPFLHRDDDLSEVHVRLCDVDKSGRCRIREGAAKYICCPRDFVCQVVLSREGDLWHLDTEGFDRLREMRRILLELVDEASIPHKDPVSTRGSYISTVPLHHGADCEALLTPCGLGM